MWRGRVSILRPSTVILSLSGLTQAGEDVTRTPLMATAPSAISRSHARREATPASASALCSRIPREAFLKSSFELIAGHPRFCLTEQDFD